MPDERSSFDVSATQEFVWHPERLRGLARRFAQSLVARLGEERVDRIILFGSVARGRHSPESDIDVLMVTEDKTDELMDAAYELELSYLLDFGANVSLKVWRRRDFERLSQLRTTFMREIGAKGIVLWKRK